MQAEILAMKNEMKEDLQEEDEPTQLMPNQQIQISKQLHGVTKPQRLKSQ